MQKDSRLGDAGASKLPVRALEHEVGDAETEDGICLLKQVSGVQGAVIQFLAHSDKL